MIFILSVLIPLYFAPSSLLPRAYKYLPQMVFLKNTAPAIPRTTKNIKGVGKLKESPKGIFPLKIKSSPKISSRFTYPLSPSSGTGPTD